MAHWITVILSAFTGGLVWEGFKFIYPQIQKRLDSYALARKNLNENMDPILKACDELYGKLFSLSNEDFATFINPRHSKSRDPNHNKVYVYYLFAQFWAHLEYIRLKSQYSSISSTKKGKELIRFIETYESREFRILDRSIQRIIGEALIEGSTTTFRILSLNKFCEIVSDDSSSLNKWISKLEEVMNSMDDKEIRQRILIFGVIAAALIDHFDPKYKIARRRAIYKNKLSIKSKNRIKRGLLGHYLPFIKNESNYY